MLKQTVITAVLLLMLNNLIGGATAKTVNKTHKAPVFKLDFNDGFNARDVNGKAIAPVDTKNAELKKGITGKMFSVDPKIRPVPKLQYHCKDVFSNESGTVMFWTRGGRLSCADGKNEKITFGWQPFLTFQLGLKGEKNPIHTIRNGEFFPTKGWYHAALTWEKDRPPRLFMNGTFFDDWQETPRKAIKGDLDLESINTLVFNAGLDEIEIYDRALSNEEIYREYRSVMPIDLVMVNDVVYADGENTKLIINAAPGGHYMFPDLPWRKYNQARALSMDVDIVSQADENMLQDGEVIQSEHLRLDVNKPMEIVINAGKLPVGKYKARCKLNDGRHQVYRDLAFYCVERTPAPVKADKTTWKREKLIFEKKFDSVDKMELSDGKKTMGKIADGTYVEGDPRGGKRFGTEIPFPKEVMGKPCLLEITWPDDKPRMMGLYMYPLGACGPHDRLAAGIIAGNEFPSSGKMRKTTYLFFPNHESYLFEARTMADDWPPAISEIRIHTTPEQFPRLALNPPKNLPARKIGFYDEDESYMCMQNRDNWELNKDVKAEYPCFRSFQMKETLPYFGYVGHTSLSQPIYRYGCSYAATDTSVNRAKRQIPYMMDTLTDQGLSFFGALYPLSHKLLGYDSVLDKKLPASYFMEDIYGVRCGGNPANPEWRKQYFSQYRLMLEQFARKNGLKGLNIAYFACWGGIENGYDEWTLRKFTKDTGIKVPGRHAKAYVYLMKEKRAEWLKWRRQQMTDLLTEFRSYADQYNPDLQLYFAINIPPKGSKEYETCEYDSEQVLKIPNLQLTANYYPYQTPYSRHKGLINDNDEKYFDLKRASLKENQNISLGMYNILEPYYETRENTLLPKKYNAYFQSSNIKPVGRHYLKQLTYAVAAYDALNISIGGQPLSPPGVEDYAREFALAYTALPALPFNTVPGVKDPVVVRSCETKNGTYFYAVNLIPFPLKVKLDFDCGFFSSLLFSYTDLSTNESCGSSTVELLPYQMRSFLIPGEKIKINSATASIPDSVFEFYRKRIAELEKSIDFLEKNGIKCPDERSKLEDVRKEMATGKLAKTHCSAFSTVFDKMLKKMSHIEEYAVRQKLMNQGIFRVNCANFNFFKDSKGTVYFPDQEFNGKNFYGYIGKDVLTARRNITELRSECDPELFRTEIYNIDGYRFQLPNGVYKVRMYMRGAYKPAFKPGGPFQFIINAQKKPLIPLIDLYELGHGDFNFGPFIEKEIKVENGLLELDFLKKPVPFGVRPSNGTERTVYAIEVTPLKQNPDTGMPSSKKNSKNNRKDWI